AKCRRRWLRDREATLRGDHRPGLAAPVLRQADEVGRPRDRFEKGDQAVQRADVDLDVVFEDKPEIEPAIDDLAPGLAVAEETADLAPARRERITRPVDGGAAERAHLA